MQDSYLKVLMEKNLFQKFKYVPEIIPEMSVEKREDVTIIMSYLDSSMFNIVCDAKFSKSDVEEKIQEILKIYGGKKLPFAWWIGPSGNPEDLGKDLVDCGFVKETDEIGMSLNLNDIKERLSINEDLKMQQVIDQKTMQDFCKIMSLYDPIASKAYYRMAELGFRKDEPFRIFVGYHKREPVVIGTLFFREKISGLCDLLTDPKERKKGYGTSMMQYLIDYSRNALAEYVSLSASSTEGLRIYEKLGFIQQFTFECYEWK